MVQPILVVGIRVENPALFEFVRNERHATKDSRIGVLRALLHRFDCFWILIGTKMANVG